MDYKWLVSPFALNVASAEASFSEYRTASRRLGEVADEHPYILFSRRNSPDFFVISKLLGELPIVCLLFHSFSNLTLRIALF